MVKGETNRAMAFTNSVPFSPSHGIRHRKHFPLSTALLTPFSSLPATFGAHHVLSEHNTNYRFTRIVHTVVPKADENGKDCSSLTAEGPMEIQIASTLQLLSESAKDKNVQIHGLKFLVETCADGRNPLFVLH